MKKIITSAIAILSASAFIIGNTAFATDKTTVAENGNTTEDVITFEEPEYNYVWLRSQSFIHQDEAEASVEGDAETTEDGYEKVVTAVVSDHASDIEPVSADEEIIEETEEETQVSADGDPEVITVNPVIYYKMSDYTYRGGKIHNACGIVSTVDCMNYLYPEIPADLGQTVDLAEDTGVWGYNRGMKSHDIITLADILDQVNGTQTCVEMVETMNAYDLAWFVDNGYPVAVNVNSSALWRGSAPGKVDHSIAVLGTDYDEYGNLIGFYIADGGLGWDYITIEQYERSAEQCTDDNVSFIFSYIE